MTRVRSHSRKSKQGRRHRVTAHSRNRAGGAESVKLYDVAKKESFGAYVPDRMLPEASPETYLYPAHGISSALAVYSREGRALGWVDTVHEGYPNAKAWMADFSRHHGRGGWRKRRSEGFKG